MNAISTMEHTVSSVAMLGAGKYDNNSHTQASDIDAAGDALQFVASSASQNRRDESLDIVDYGCAEGQNSRQMTEIMLNAVPTGSRHPYISIFRNDLHTNDFSSLTRAAQKTDCSESARHTSVFEFIRPGSFYEQVMPANSVDIACSFSALHWLRRLPEHLQTLPHVTGECESVQPAFANQAAADWTEFLSRRATELRVNGRLVISLVARKSGCGHIHGPFALLNSAIQELVAAGQIDEARYRQFYMPIHRRTVEEAIVPFQDRQHPLFGAFALESLEIEELPPLLGSMIERGEAPTTAVSRYVGFIRAFSEPVIRAGLFDLHQIDPGTVSASIDCLYARMEELVALDRSLFDLHKTRILMVLRRRSRHESLSNPKLRGRDQGMQALSSPSTAGVRRMSA